MSSSLLSKKESLEKSIREKSRDGIISCPALRKIAEQSGVPYKDAGRAANELKIKIKNCDLGCF